MRVIGGRPPTSWRPAATASSGPADSRAALFAVSVSQSWSSRVDWASVAESDSDAESAAAGPGPASRPRDWPKFDFDFEVGVIVSRWNGMDDEEFTNGMDYEEYLNGR